MKQGDKVRIIRDNKLVTATVLAIGGQAVGLKVRGLDVVIYRDKKQVLFKIPH